MCISTLLFLFFFSNVYTFFSALHLSNLPAVGKGFPDPIHIGSALHFQVEIGQDSVESHGEKMP